MPTGRLRVEIRDQQTHKVIHARVYLTDRTGKRWTPARSIIYDKGPEHHFISSGALQSGSHLVFMI
jgi:hypothetical protein